MERNLVTGILGLIDLINIHQVVHQIQYMAAGMADVLQIAFPFFLFTGFRGQFHAVVDITQWSSYIVRDGQDDLFTHTEQFLVLTVYPLELCPPFPFFPDVMPYDQERDEYQAYR